MKNLLNLLFPVPETCSFSARRAYKNGICKLCLGNLQPIIDSICERCGRSIEKSFLCADCCRRKDTYFICNRSALHYNPKMKEVISLYKFRGLETLAHSLIPFLEDVYGKYYVNIDFDAITFVPLHEKRLHERGFNQAQQLAFLLSLRTKIPVYSLLTRVRYSEKQSKKHRKERLRVLGDPFEFKVNSQAIRRVLLVDDVYTTGTTVNECAKVLVKEGMEVYSITVAR